MDVSIASRKHGVAFGVKVQAGAKRTAVAGSWNQAVKLQIAKPAADGAANSACIAFLADILQVSRQKVKIIKGEFSSHKVIEVEGLTAEQVRERLHGA